MSEWRIARRLEAAPYWRAAFDRDSSFERFINLAASSIS
jgi:hypothetical protein